MDGGTSITLALQRAGIIAGLSLTKGGQLRINAFNATGEVIGLTPKIAMVNVHANQLEIRYFGRDPKVLNIER